MAIEISKEARTQAITSIERYFRENMKEPIGNMAAGALLGFFLEEVGPLVYNYAVSDVQDRLQALAAKDRSHHPGPVYTDSNNCHSTW